MSQWEDLVNVDLTEVDVTVAVPQGQLRKVLDELVEARERVLEMTRSHNSRSSEVQSLQRRRRILGDRIEALLEERQENRQALAENADHLKYCSQCDGARMDKEDRLSILEGILEDACDINGSDPAQAADYGLFRARCRAARNTRGES